MATALQLGHVGIWWSGRWPKDRGELGELLGRLHSLGFETVWRSGGYGEGLSPEFGRLLEANGAIKVASGIHSVWTTSAEDTAEAVARLEEAHPGRFLLGLGVSHAPAVEHGGQRYTHPYSKMQAYLDRLDTAGAPVAPERRVLAALGPKMLALAAERAAGAHPYFVPLEHTEGARALLGEGPLLAPEVAVVLEEDPERARALARGYMETYLKLPNYTENLRRLGYGAELSGGGSDRLVDAVVAWGDEAAVAARVRAHLDAGADHVCLQVLNGGYGAFPLAEYELLAPGLFPL
jgi:probable F420-dependent oxidoreductase